MRSSLRFRALTGLAAMMAVALSFSVAASPASKSKKVYWVDLGGQASQAPDYVFFTANSGGFMEDITWKNWGGKRTVGNGTFGTTAPCNGQPCPEGPAKLVLRRPIRCTPSCGSKKGKKIRVYKRGKLTYPDGRHRGRRRQRPDQLRHLQARERALSSGVAPGGAR